MGARVLAHYDLTKLLSMSVDASPYEIGVVLSHVMEDGAEKLIAFASRSLSAAEENYAQIEKEGLAIIYGVNKFFMYLYGHRFILVIDHKPLTRN